MAKEIRNGSRYPKEYKEKVITEFKRRAKSKTGVTYAQIAREFNLSHMTVLDWVTGYRSTISATIRPDGNLYYKGTTYAPIR